MCCVASGGDKFRRRDIASPSCCRGCWPSQSQRLPRELRSLIARTIPFRVTYGNGPWNQRKNTNLISAVGCGGLSGLRLYSVSSLKILFLLREQVHQSRTFDPLYNGRYIIYILFREKYFLSRMRFLLHFFPLLQYIDPVQVSFIFFSFLSPFDDQIGFYG